MPPAKPQPFDATEIVWIWDPERGRIVWATPGAVAFWGERSEAELVERPFLADDPNAVAMNALFDAPRPDTAEGGDADDRQATLTFYPDGAPIRMLCQGRVRHLERRRKGTWLAIHAAPAALSEGDEAAAASREALLLERSETAFALITAAGAPLFLNAAARRMFGVASAAQDEAASGSLFERYSAPDRARRAAAAAMLRGSFSHTAELLPAPGRNARASILYRSLIDPLSGETILSLEAAVRPERNERAFSQLRKASETAAPGASRIAVAMFDLTSLKLREASASSAAMLGLSAGSREATLPQIFPEHTDALEQAVQALRSGGEAQTLDLSLDDPESGRGPWGAARLSVVAEPGGPQLMLTLLDLGPERRRMLLGDQERRAGAAALSALRVGLVFVDERGMVRRADTTAGAALGLPADALAQRLEAGVELPALLQAPWRDELRARITRAFEAPLPDGAVAPPPIETVLTDTRGEPKLVRLAVSERLAFGRRLVCVAMDMGDRPPAPQELRALASDAAPRTPGDQATRDQATGDQVSGGPPPEEQTSGEQAAAANPRAFRAASHAFRTALTTIRGFAELARDDAAHPLSARQRRRLSDIIETAVSLTGMVERTFGRAADNDAGPKPRAAQVDLAEIAALAAARSAARHPAWGVAAQQPIPAETATETAADDLNEALDILLAEAADRGPTRLTAWSGENGGGAEDSGGAHAVIELETVAEAPSHWPPIALRAAELLVERAGGRLEFQPTAPEADPIVRIRLVFDLSRD